MQLEEIQAQCVSYNTKAGQAHGRGAKHGIQLQVQRFYKHPRRQRNTDNVVEKSPEQIFMNVAQSVRGMKLGDKDLVEGVYYTQNAMEASIQYKNRNLVLNSLKLGRRDSKGVKVRG